MSGLKTVVMVGALVGGIGYAYVKSRKADDAAEQRSRSAPVAAIGRTYVAELRASLRNLSMDQQRYFLEHDRYSASLSELQFRALGPEVMTVESADAKGWYARVKHPGSGEVCEMFVGQVGRTGKATRESEMVCGKE